MDDLKKLIIDVFKPKKGENFIILNDFPQDDLEITNDYIHRRHFARMWYHDLLELSKKIKINVEDMITYEPTKINNSPLPKKAIQSNKEIDFEKKLKNLGKNDIVLAINSFSATATLKELAKKQKFRGASMPGVTEDMTGFEADYSSISKKANILAEKLTNAIGADVKLSTGAEIYFDLRKHSGLADNGDISKPGKTGNLPSGEAYICPYAGFDKRFGESKTKGILSVYYGSEKVVFIIEKGRIVDVEGLSKKANDMKTFFEEDPARSYIAEFGLGCNETAEFCGKTIQDEKIEGFHFAYGYNGHFGGEIKKSKFKSKNNIIHQDIVYSLFSKVQVSKIVLHYQKDSEIIMVDSKYVDGLFN
jgi:leucyl aminopeptidase (aminopeptidase T)